MLRLTRFITLHALHHRFIISLIQCKLHGIRSFYDEGKRCAETLFVDYQWQHNIEIKVMRIFNIFRPRVHRGDGRVVSNFIVRESEASSSLFIMMGSRLVVFCYVDARIV